MIDPIELDYVYLMHSLKERARPRDRVTTLLRSGELVRVKKGLYVRPDSPYSRELLANLVYGPSYLSLEYALSYHNLTPEAVNSLTSVTTQKNKRFDTAVGRFEYRHLGLGYFPAGIERVEMDDGRAFLIATPAKALFDFLYLRTPSVGAGEIEDHLFANLRIDRQSFEALDFGPVCPLIDRCPRASIRALKRILPKHPPSESPHG